MRLRHHLGDERSRCYRRETALDRFREGLTGPELDHSEDLVALAFTRRLNGWLFTMEHPRTAPASPLRERCFVYKVDASVALPAQFANRGPHLFGPAPPTGLFEVVREETSLLVREDKVFQQLGNVEDGIEDAEGCPATLQTLHRGIPSRKAAKKSPKQRRANKSRCVIDSQSPTRLKNQS